MKAVQLVGEGRTMICREPIDCSEHRPRAVPGRWIKDAALGQRLEPLRRRDPTQEVSKVVRSGNQGQQPLDVLVGHRLGSREGVELGVAQVGREEQLPQDRSALLASPGTRRTNS